MRTLVDASLSDEERTLLQRFTRDLRADDRNPPEAIWLFGSRARGEHPREYSDIDVLVLVDDDSWQAKSRIHDTLQAAARELGLEATAVSFCVHVRTPEWLHQRRQIASFFVAEVDRDKVPA